MARVVGGAPAADVRRGWSAPEPWPASKTTTSRLVAPADTREPSSATGSVRSSSDSMRVPSGRVGTCADGAPAVTTWSTVNVAERASAAISAAATPP